MLVWTHHQYKIKYHLTEEHCAKKGGGGCSEVVIKGLAGLLRVFCVRATRHSSLTSCVVWRALDSPNPTVWASLHW